MDVLNTDRKSKHNSQKIGKFILILIGIATIQWASSTTTSLSSISSFIQSSGKGSKLARIFERTPPRLDESAETSASTVLLIHYHKTGNNFIVDLLTEIDKTHQQHRHDLAMKDPFILNREFKKAEEQQDFTAYNAYRAAAFAFMRAVSSSKHTSIVLNGRSTNAPSPITPPRRR